MVKACCSSSVCPSFTSGGRGCLCFCIDQNKKGNPFSRFILLNPPAWLVSCRLIYRDLRWQELQVWNELILSPGSWGWVRPGLTGTTSGVSVPSLWHLTTQRHLVTPLPCLAPQIHAAGGIWVQLEPQGKAGWRLQGPAPPGWSRGAPKCCWRELGSCG